jgi:ABC-2 type transport system permease protein
VRHFLTILSHEIRMLLVSPGTYVAAVLFLTLMGFIFTGVIEVYTKDAQDIPPAAMFFQLFWLPVLFMVPLLTMKCLSEERRLGTLETLLAAPVNATEVVLGKFGATYLLYLGLWAMTGGYFWILHHFDQNPRLLEPGPLLGGYLFIAVSGLLFVALGVLASSLTRHQAVAGIITVVLLLFLVWGPRVALNHLVLLDLPSLQPVRAALDYMLVFRHLDDFTRGIADTREMLYYLSGAGLALVFSVFSVEAKHLHS